MDGVLDAPLPHQDQKSQTNSLSEWPDPNILAKSRKKWLCIQALVTQEVGGFWYFLSLHALNNPANHPRSSGE
jgi:hypothetical protein